jgi:hypothetical protein
MKRVAHIQRINRLTFLLLGLTSLMIYPKISLSQGNENKSGSELMDRINILCSEKMGGRLAGTAGEKYAADYISEYFFNSGLRPVLDTSYFKYFEFTGQNGKKDTAINVIGYLDNNSQHTVIICAHFDHIGFGKGYTQQPGTNELHPGADDNASGVAVLLDLAKSLAQFPGLKNNYLFAAFSGHEEGLKGSRNFVRTKACPTEKLLCIIDIDMIGRLDKAKPVLLIKKSTLCTEFDTMINELPHPDFQIMKVMTGQDDIADFCLLSIPAVTFSTGINPDHHTPNDTPEKINIEGLNNIRDYIFSMIIEIDSKGAIRKK